MLTIFVPLMMGIMDFGQFLYFHQALSDRTQAAARWASVNPFDEAQIANVAIYNDPAGAANGAAKVLPYLNTVAGTEGYVSAKLSGAGTEDARVTVTISSYPNGLLILPSTINHRTLSATEPYELDH